MFSLVWKACALPSSRMGMDGHSVTAKLASIFHASGVERCSGCRSPAVGDFVIGV